MSPVLPRLRVNLDFMPSPVEDRPGLLVRDGYHYTPTTLIVPPLLTACLDLFDGERRHATRHPEGSSLRIRRAISRPGVMDHPLLDTLDQAGFLENETRYFEIRARRGKKGFAEASHTLSGPTRALDIRATPSSSRTCFRPIHDLRRCRQRPDRALGLGQIIGIGGSARQPFSEAGSHIRPPIVCSRPKIATAPSSSSARRTTVSPIVLD